MLMYPIPHCNSFLQVYGIESVITGVKTTCFFLLQNGISDGAEETCEEGHIEGETIKERSQKR